MKFFYILSVLILILPDHVIGQQLLNEEYFFINEDGLTGLKLGKDSLNMPSYFNDFRNKGEINGKHYRIISVKQAPPYVFLKLEKLDPLQLSTSPFPDARFMTFILEIHDSKSIRYIYEPKFYTRQQIDTLQYSSSPGEKFGITFYSRSYLDELLKLKSFTGSVNERGSITNIIKTLKYQAIIEKYKKTDVKDLYSSDITAELLNLALVELGYNPVGAIRMWK